MSTDRKRIVLLFDALLIKIPIVIRRYHHFTHRVANHCCQSLRYCNGDGKVTFITSFLMLGKVNCDEQVNILERYCTCDISCPFTSFYGSLSNIKGL